MKRIVGLSQILLLVVFMCLAAPTVKSLEKNNGAGEFINRIDGIVWDPYRRPVSDVYVELQNETYSTLSRIRTTSSGRFSFTVNKQGNFYVKVLASGTNYEDAIEPVEIVNVTVFSSDSQYVDVYLKFDKRKINTGISGVTEAVFVQEVPDAARQLYKDGIKEIGNGNNRGLDSIEQALKIFPNYYDALNTLGQTYVQRKEYQKSFPYLIKAIEINQRSFSAFYALGYAAYQLNFRTEAKEAARAATVLQPKSVNAQLLYGTILRQEGSFESAEKILLQAKALSKDMPVAEVHWQLALLYNKIGKNKEAVAELETYLKVQPNADNKKEIKDLIAKLRKETE